MPAPAINQKRGRHSEGGTGVQSRSIAGAIGAALNFILLSHEMIGVEVQ
jgi:hypothetical protein